MLSAGGQHLFAHCGGGRAPGTKHMHTGLWGRLEGAAASLPAHAEPLPVHQAWPVCRCRWMRFRPDAIGGMGAIKWTAINQ